MQGNGTGADGAVDLLQQAGDDVESTPDPVVATNVFLSNVCVVLQWPAGIFYLVDPSSPRMLTATHHAYFDALRFPEGLEVIARRPPGDALKGLGGRVLDTGKPAWSAHVTQDADFRARGFARLLGIQGAIALPVFIGTRLGAVAEFFSAHPLNPEPRLLSGLQSLAYRLGGHIDRLNRGQER